MSRSTALSYLPAEAVRRLSPDEWRCLRSDEVPEGAAVVGGYGLRFSTPHVDGYHFAPDVNLGPSAGDGVDVSFNHHVPIRADDLPDKVSRELADHVFMPARATRDELGVWVEAVLREADEYEAFVAELVGMGKLGWSPGSASHTARVRNIIDDEEVDLWWAEALPGAIVRFPVVEWALTPTPADPRARAVPLRSIDVDADGSISDEQPDQQNTATAMDNDKDREQQQEAIRKAVAEALAAERAAEEERRKAEELEAMKAELEALRSQVKKQSETRSDTSYDGVAPAVVDGSQIKYDNYSIGELALGISICGTAARSNITHGGRFAEPFSPPAYAALARRIEESKESRESQNYTIARTAMRTAFAQQGRSLKDAIRANEAHYSSQANAIDEWVGVAYSGDLWDLVRLRANVVGLIPNYETPPGVESVTLPVLDGDVTWYLVGEATDMGSNPGGRITEKATASKLNSGSASVTLSKLGARAYWTGEVTESAVLPFVSVLRDNFAESGADSLESAIIDGDTSTTTNTNVNYAATAPGGTEYWLAWNGFRHLGLKTNTANSRDAGALTAEDFLETVKLMGTAGIDGLDKMRVFFISDVRTMYKAMELSEVKTRDVFVSPTIENGALTGIWGYRYFTSANFHRPSANRLANTSGLIDGSTAANNTTGSLVSVRSDHWRFYWRRRMTMETTRVPAADATELVALIRAGLINRDTDAAAISYNITV